ncbi:MAG: hypothetical protein K2L59_03400 [Muribaculaceae bacterium]|nr:hypothetical protein [Muribaculaceae bacterium]
MSAKLAKNAHNAKPPAAREQRLSEALTTAAPPSTPTSRRERGGAEGFALSDLRALPLW